MSTYEERTRAIIERIAAHAKPLVPDLSHVEHELAQLGTVLSGWRATCTERRVADDGRLLEWVTVRAEDVDHWHERVVALCERLRELRGER